MPAQTTTTVANTVSQGAVFVPSYVTTSITNITSNHSESTNGFESETEACNEDFHVTGAFQTCIFNAEQGQATIDDAWAQNGIRNSSYNQGMPTFCPCKCDCHSSCPKADGSKCGTNCDCFHGIGCDHRSEHAQCTDPDDDIERRINEEVQRTISDLLSDIVNRCISTSLQGCIEIE